MSIDGHDNDSSPTKAGAINIDYLTKSDDGTLDKRSFPKSGGHIIEEPNSSATNKKTIDPDKIEVITFERRFGNKENQGIDYKNWSK